MVTDSFQLFIAVIERNLETTGNTEFKKENISLEITKYEIIFIRIFKKKLSS